jgi:hypothetical protein
MKFFRGNINYIILLIVFLFIVSSCASRNSESSSNANPPGNILEFEDYSIDFGMEYLDVSTHIYVVPSLNSPLPDEVLYVSPDTKSELDAFDFSQYFILFAFMGSQSLTGPTIKVTQIWQIDNTIYVEALFDQGGPTYQPMYSSPVYIVKVSKNNMTQFGEITFILLDQEGAERTRTVYNINQ